NGQLNVDVAAHSGEQRMRSYADFDESIAGTPAANARMSLTLEPKNLSVSRARRNGDIERLSIRETQPPRSSVCSLDEIHLQCIGHVGPAQPNALPSGRPEQLGEYVVGEGIVLP